MPAWDWDVADVAPTYRLGYERDPDGAIESLDQDGFLVRYQRDQTGNLSGFELDEGTLIELPGPREVVRDELGRICQDELDRNFSYDDAGRLAECTGADGRSTTYSYGQSGLLSAEREESLTQQFVYNPGGQLIQRVRPEGNVDYRYDAVGRQTSSRSGDGSSVRYRWDALDQLVGIQRRDRHGICVINSITYDGFNNPVVIDKVPIVWDLGNSGKAIRLGDSRYLRYGSQIHPLDVPGCWTAGLSADPWGCDGAKGLRLGFRGEVALGPLVFMGARVYDSEARCFLSPDPAPPQPGALTFAGPYNYAWNDPINNVDPTGLKPLLDQDYEQIRRRQEDCFVVNWAGGVAHAVGSRVEDGAQAVGSAAAAVNDFFSREGRLQSDGWAEGGGFGGLALERVIQRICARQRLAVLTANDNRRPPRRRCKRAGPVRHPQHPRPVHRGCLRWRSPPAALRRRPGPRSRAARAPVGAGRGASRCTARPARGRSCRSRHRGDTARRTPRPAGKAYPTRR